jgi:hypothetical protein
LLFLLTGTDYIILLSSTLPDFSIFFLNLGDSSTATATSILYDLSIFLFIGDSSTTVTFVPLNFLLGTLFMVKGLPL